MRSTVFVQIDSVICFLVRTLLKYVENIRHETNHQLWKEPEYNTLRSRRNRHHFADDIFKCIFLNENVSISIKISLKFIPNNPINNIPALGQIMAWRWPRDKPLSEPMITIVLTRMHHFNNTRSFLTDRSWSQPPTISHTVVWWTVVVTDVLFTIRSKFGSYVTITSKQRRDVILTKAMGCNFLSVLTDITQRTHNTIITSLLHQNNIATSFWRNNDVIIASCVRWEDILGTEPLDWSTEYDKDPVNQQLLH